MADERAQSSLPGLPKKHARAGAEVGAAPARPALRELEGAPGRSQSGRSACGGRCPGRSNCPWTRPSRAPPGAGSAAACTRTAPGAPWAAAPGASAGRVGGRAGLRRRQMPAAHAQVTAHVTSSSRPNLNPVLWKGRSACSRAGRAASGGGARAPAAVELGEVRAVLAHGRAALAAELLHHRLLLGRALANQLQQLVAPARGRIRVRARRTPLLTSHPWRCPCRARARVCWRCGPRPACS